MARKKYYKNVFAHSEGRSVVTERFIRILKKIKFINTWFQYQKMFILIIEIP